jgi:hypothetical protein
MSTSTAVDALKLLKNFTAADTADFLLFLAAKKAASFFCLTHRINELRQMSALLRVVEQIEQQLRVMFHCVTSLVELDKISREIASPVWLKETAENVRRIDDTDRCDVNGDRRFRVIRLERPIRFINIATEIFLNRSKISPLEFPAARVVIES